MGGAILSIIAHKIKSLQCVILWDPANPSLTPKERSSVRQSIKNKTNPITKFDWFTGNTKINKAWDPYKLSLDIFGEKCNLTIAKNLKRINVPIFVIFGDYDEIVPFEPSKKWFINFFKNKKDFEFITIKNASHSPWKTHLRQLIISFNHCLKKIT
jgi:pimeloyl-ACP methyl ester carboxylesterase